MSDAKHILRRLVKIQYFHQRSACTKNVTDTLSNSIEKDLKCNVDCRLCKSQSAGDKVVTWPI